MIKIIPTQTDIKERRDRVRLSSLNTCQFFVVKGFLNNEPVHVDMMIPVRFSISNDVKI